MKIAKDYYSTHLVPYENPKRIGFLSVEVLPFLKGKQWDDVALAYVHSLRPTSIRVTEGTIKLDSRSWRVTVYVNKDNVIEEITQEVEVGLPDKVVHGGALQDALTFGIDSPQCQWYNDKNIACICHGFDGSCSKLLNDGTQIPYPDPKENGPIV